MALLCRRHESLKLVFVGKGDLEAELKRESRKLGLSEKVTFLGWRKDVQEIMQVFDIFVLPSLNEGIGRVLIEAMAAGLPVLATDVCGFSDHIESAGAGELVPSPFQQETLNHLLVSMLTSADRPNWGANGQEYVAKTDVFSRPEKAADIIEQVVGC